MNIDDANSLLSKPSAFTQTLIGVEPFEYQKEFLDADSDRRVFVAGRRVGKSRCASWLSLWYAVTHKNAEVLLTAKAQRQSMELFNQIKKEIKNSDIPKSEWGIPRQTRTELEFDNGSRIVCLPVGRDGSNIRGYGADLLIVDEAAFINDEIFQEVLSPFLAVGDSTFVMTSTPFGKKGFFYEKCQDDDWYTQRVPTWKNPLVDDKWIKEQQQNLTTFQFDQEIRGQFKESADAYFSNDEVMLCAADNVQQTSDVTYLGADIAHTGDDESVYVMMDDEGNVFKIEHTSGKPLTDAMGRIRELNKYHDFDKILIDSTGLGTGVVDQLYESIGKRTVEGFKFTNEKKQSLYSTLKNALQDEALRYSYNPTGDDPENKMVEQLTALEYSYTSTGKVKISHPTGGRDDFPDALALAVWAKENNRFTRVSHDTARPFNLGSLR